MTPQNFTGVVYDSAQSEIARVNRKTGVLYLKPQIWDRLPEGERDFVLWHERGHLVLQTTDEYKANEFAVKNFAPVQTLSNHELKSRITVMRSILTPGKEDEISGFDPVTAVSGAIGSVFQALPMMGVGSKSRQQEAAANAEAQVEIIAAQQKANDKSNQTYLVWGVVGGAFLITAVVLYFIFRK